VQNWEGHDSLNETPVISVRLVLETGVWQWDGGEFGWLIALQHGRSRVRFPVLSLRFFIELTLLGSTQPLTEMSTRDLSWRVKAAGA
jgi:hypothetical protein